jgi:hypothetical protein
LVFEEETMHIRRFGTPPILCLLGLLALAAPGCGDDTNGATDADADVPAEADAATDADADVPAEADAATDADADVPAEAEAEAGADADADACPVCLDGTYEFGWIGGMGAWVESFSVAPCASLAARREDYGGTVLASCDADISGCDPAAAVVTSAHVTAAIAAADVQTAFGLGSVLYGNDSRPVDGAVFRIARGGTTVAEILVGDPCGAVDPGCLPVPAGVAHLRDVLQALITQVPSYPGVGCSTW